MANLISGPIPGDKLRRLDFLLGENMGLETLYAPGRPPVQFDANFTASWEECERFIKLDFYAEIPGMGSETFRALITWSEAKQCYRMWLFSSSEEEPRHMTGDFIGERLVLISDPWRMPWGLQRIRSTFTPHSDGSLGYKAELWEPDGYTKYVTVTYTKHG